MHLNAYIHAFIWPYIIIYAAFRRPRGAQDFFTMHSHPGSWCMLHQASMATVQLYLTSMQRAAVPAQLP